MKAIKFRGAAERGVRASARQLVIAAAMAVVLPFSGFARAEEFGTAEEAKAMLEKAVTMVQADKAKALEMFQAGEGGFKDRDLYTFCSNAGDGVITAHPTLKGQNLAAIKDKNGKALGEEMMKVASEGTFSEVTYMWPRPGADTTPVDKVSFVTRVGDQICGVGYYK